MPKTLKESVPAAVRWEVWRRDDFTCHYCGAKEGSVTVDHKVPESAGGPTVSDNLVTACLKCNTRKATKSYESFKIQLHFEKQNLSLIVRKRRNKGLLARSMRWRENWPSALQRAAGENTDRSWTGFQLFYAACVYDAIAARFIRCHEQNEGWHIDADYVLCDLRSRWVGRHFRWCQRLGLASWAPEPLFDSVDAAFQVFRDNLDGLAERLNSRMRNKLSLPNNIALAIQAPSANTNDHFGRLLSKIDDNMCRRTTMATMRAEIA